MNYISRIEKIIYNENSNYYRIYFSAKETRFSSYLNVPIPDAKNIALSRENINSNRLKTYNTFIDLISLLSIKIIKIIISKKKNKIISNIFLEFNNKEYKLTVNYVDAIIISIKTFSLLYLHKAFFISDNFSINENYKIDLDKNSKQSIEISNLKNILKLLVQNEEYESAALVRNKINKILD